MDWIALFLEDSPSLRTLTEEPSSELSNSGKSFVEVIVEGDPIFYDYYRNSNDVIVGIEIHLHTTSDGPKGLLETLKNLPYVEFSPFPIVWFRDQGGAVPMGVEGFGDLKLFRSENGTMALAFCPGNWIGQIQQ